MLGLGPASLLICLRLVDLPTLAFLVSLVDLPTLLLCLRKFEMELCFYFAWSNLVEYIWLGRYFIDLLCGINLKCFKNEFFTLVLFLKFLHLSLPWSYRIMGATAFFNKDNNYSMFNRSD